MANESNFNYPTVDLLGNLQSSKTHTKSIKQNEIPYYVAFFGGYPVYTDTLEQLKKFVASSSLSAEIKNNVANLTNKTWEDVNVAFLRPKTAVNPIYFKNEKQEYVFIFDVIYRDWYKKEYDGPNDSFLKAAARPVTTPDKPYSWFQNNWLTYILSSETELLRGNFVQENRLGFSKVATGGYVKSQQETYQYVTTLFNGLKEKAQNGTLPPDARKDFGSVFNLPNDPDPALPGPQTQTISGVTNKAPVVDNPNIKLPSQEVKGLDVNVAQRVATQSQDVTSNTVSQSQSALGNTQQSAGGVLSNLSSGVKGVLGGGVLGAGIGALAGGGKGALIGAGAGALAGGVAGSVVDKSNPKGITPDGLGKDWSPDKVNPESFAGNDKFVDPKTGTIGSTSKLSTGLKGGLLGAGLGAGIGGLVGGGKGAVIGAVSGGAVGVAAAKLASVQTGLPKPKIPKPVNTPRIKTIKIPRPSNTKGATDLLNLPKSSLG